MTSSDQSPAEFVKAYAPDFYTASFFAKADKRQALIWLYAFGLELAQIAPRVSEPMLGEIRLQWWRDALKNAKEGQVSGHPVADHFAQVIQTYQLPDLAISNLIDARSFDISMAPMPDLSALKVYLHKTVGMIGYLGALIAGHETEKPQKLLEQISTEFAIAYGVTEVLQTLPSQARRGHLFVPETIMEDHGINMVDVVQGRESPELARLVQGLGEEAEQSYKKLQNLFMELPADMFPAFLPATLVPYYFSIMTKKHHKPLYHLAHINPLKRLWRYWQVSAFGKI